MRRAPSPASYALCIAFLLSAIAVVASLILGILAGRGEIGQTTAVPVGGPCPLTDTRFDAAPVGLRSLAESGCAVLASDTGAIADPGRLWGVRSSAPGIDCAAPDRHIRMPSGGDPQPTATDEWQAGDSPLTAPFRRLTVQDGDDISGERCELGHNEWRAGPQRGRRLDRRGTFALYPAGVRRATFFSLRLTDRFPLDTQSWQTVMQMKQANPSQASSPVPVLAMDAGSAEGAPRFRVYSNGRNPSFHGQSFPARKSVWIRFVFDVYYHPNPARGWIQVSADLNGDGDLDDDDETGKRIRSATLEEQQSDGFELAAGTAIPSHLRLGIYHDAAIECPGDACSIDIDNVQVLGG